MAGLLAPGRIGRAQRTLAVLLCAAAAFAGRAGTAEDWRRTLAEARALRQKGGPPDEVAQHYEAALPALRKSDRHGLALALCALSELASVRGAYEVATAKAREAADVFRSLGDTPGEALAFYLVGVAELYQAHYAPALVLLDDALALARQSGEREREVQALNNIGTAHYLQAGYLDALRAYREAMDALDKSGNEGWSGHLRRITLTNLAALFQRLGQDQQALRIYAGLRAGPEALSASEQARLLSNLGALYRRLGDPVKALETYRAAERVLAAQEDPDARLGLLRNIGIVQALDMGDLAAALTAFTDALAIAGRTGNRRGAMQARLYRGEALYRSGRSPEAAREFETAIAAAKELGTTEEEWKGLYGLGRIARAAGQDEVAAERFGEAIGRIESVRSRLQLSSLKSDFLADKRDAYDALLEILLGRRDGPAMFDLLERARARTFQDRLAIAPPTLAAAQALLDGHTLLLEYWAGPRSAALLWVTHDKSGLVELPASAVDPRETSALLEAASGFGDDWRQPAASLGAHLLPPAVRNLPPEIQHVVVVSDGPLADVPFELLDSGAGAPLIERFDVSYLPTAALLSRPSAAARRWIAPWSRQLVVFADPRVLASGGRGAPEFGGAELAEPLPASGEEAHAIAQACPGRARLYLGEANLKKDLLQGAAAGVPLLHLATHAVADVMSPERSRILFSPVREEDGADYLFLKEVYDLDLRGVDLATLSACESERGKLVRGEGPQAFSRALLSAGARATVTALWRVTDEPTRDFMKQFYFELNRGASKAQALRLTKLRFLHSGTVLAHPRCWAGFILSGDGLSPIPRVLSWSGLLGLAGVLLASAVVVTRRRPPMKQPDIRRA